jgi:hypothetical protein
MADGASWTCFAGGCCSRKIKRKEVSGATRTRLEAYESGRYEAQKLALACTGERLETSVESGRNGEKALSFASVGRWLQTLICICNWASSSPRMDLAHSSVQTRSRRGVLGFRRRQQLGAHLNKSTLRCALPMQLLSLSAHSHLLPASASRVFNRTVS